MAIASLIRLVIFSMNDDKVQVLLEAAKNGSNLLITA